MHDRFTRREWITRIAQVAAVSPALGFSLWGNACGGGGSNPSPGPPPGDNYPGTDDQLLDEIERASFLFFWEQTDPTTGQVKDRALAGGNDSRTISSIAATGFGLTVLCVGDQRGYQPSQQITDRVRTTLRFLLNQMPQQNGFFYHFVDMTTGARAFSSEVSSIDTAILLCGVLTCRKHFQDSEIVSLATQLYERVDWFWMLNGSTTLSHGWTPESGFLSARWDIYSELMMLYLLAIGSPTHPIPPASWSAWARPTILFQGLSYISPAAPLFVHQYSHAWFDFRSKQDAFANYFQNSITATQAHRLFCLSLNSRFSDYSNDLWGITASDSVNGYVVWGGPPSIGPIDGTVVPAATGGSLPFLPPETIHVLRWIRGHYPNAWKRYGFVDAFNPLNGWYNPDVIGINLGNMAVMAENARSGSVWQTFMQNPEASAAMSLSGFH
jgi:hypothetical protein